MGGVGEQRARGFAEEVAHLRASNVFGERGRLRELFDYLADRGAEAPPASQADIADEVFGQTDVAADDATVRVYVHRLRKRLDEHYAAHGDDGGRLTVPAGAYALRLAGADVEPPPLAQGSRRRTGWWAAAVLALVLVAGAFAAGRWLAPAETPANPLWRPLVASDRPLTIVLGDYYIFGEIDPLRPEDGRLIRDFRINSPTDLARVQETDPQRYGDATDIGLNYLPFSAAYALRDLLPVLVHASRPVQVIAASQFHADELRDSDIVYIGLISGMGMLEDTVFERSTFSVGETYDEIYDTRTDKSYVSGEAQSLAMPVAYQDFAYVTRFRAPGGAQVAVVAGTRDTGLRGVAPLLADQLDPSIEQLAERGDFEAIYEITGQQGADLSKRLLVARARP